MNARHIPTEEQAFDFITEALRCPQGLGLKDRYDVYLPILVERYVGEPTNSPDVMGPFFSAVWSLCRLGVLRPGPQRTRDFGQGHDEALGYCITEFGKRWILETPPLLPTQPAKMTDMLHSVGKQFGDVYRLRSRDAVLSYNAVTADCKLTHRGCGQILGLV
jgi:hypothetical protein